MRITPFAVFLLLFLPSNAKAQEAEQYEVSPVFVETAPRIDGHLDDAVWQDIESISDFVQVWPEDGAPASERTEVRIAYDRDHLYFAFKFWDQNPELIRAKNLERGGRNDRDDHAYIGLDTYLDGRNAYLFEMNALGTQDDATITDEAISTDSFSWDAVYASETVIDEEGWSMEVSIPFRQLRFPKGEVLDFGLMLSRMINRKNERSLWPPIGLEYGSSFSVISRVSRYGRLTGMKNIRRGKNIEIKPYVITGAQEVRPDLGIKATESDFTREVGLDVKYAIRSDLTLDLTVNTDFAQVESDNVQLNLTRFSLFFPEKREFFLERSGLFEHGTPRSTQTFFSRRIGLTENILAGGRMTGQVGRFAVGLLNIETGDEMNDLLGSRSANNTVVRVRTDVVEGATVGAIVTNLDDARGYNRAVGMDGQYRFWGSSEATAWFSRVMDSDPGNEGAAGRVLARIQNDRYGAQASFTSVDENYRPALGFVRRRDMRQYAGRLLFTPVVQLSALPMVRQFSFQGDYSYIEGQDGLKQSTEAMVRATADFNRRDRISLTYHRQTERLEDAFYIRPTAQIVAGDYTFAQAGVWARSDPSRRFFFEAQASTGGFYGGDRTDAGGNIGFRHSQYLTIEGGIRRSMIDLPIANGSFDATTLTASVLAAVNKKLFAKALIQYDNFSRDLQANIRIDWIHTPGSDLFLVFNTAAHFAADSEILFDPRRDSVMRDRVGVAKLTYLILL